MSTGRSIWSGTIAFGLVTVPVKLQAATEDREGVKFHQVHRQDGHRIQMKRFCSADGEEVPYADVAKAIEWGEGSIVFEDADIAELPLPTTRQITVEHFCAPSQVDPIMFSKSYYVVPALEGAEHAYELLAGVLHSREVAAIAKVALRQRERLCMVAEREGILVLTTLLWPEEVREVPTRVGTKPTTKEYQLAHALVDAMTMPFSPAEHSDNYKAAVLAIAERKAAGEAAVAPEPEQVVIKAPDLESLLHAALAKAKAEGTKVNPLDLR